MKYNIRKTTRNTARIAFEARLPPLSKPPEIQRILFDDFEHVLHITGNLLGVADGQACALVIEARQDDLISITDADPSTGSRRIRYFRIGQGYQPVAIAPPDKPIAPVQQTESLRVSGADQSALQPRDEMLRSLFKQTHPTWLRKILERQIRHWKRNDPDSYYRFAPLPLVERDLRLLPGIAPFAALARFKNRLDRLQIARCVGNSPKGAVIFATNEIPERDRKTYLVAHAMEALEFAAHRLTDKDLGVCAKVAMVTAYRVRGRMTGHRRAIMLANTYQTIVRDRRSLTEVQAELRRSLLEYPDQWLATDPGGLPSILKGLRHVGVSFESGFITTLQSRVGSVNGHAMAGGGVDKS